MRFLWRVVTGGIAALNHRLQAGKPSASPKLPEAKMEVISQTNFPSFLDIVKAF
jgi:hypothetical protein